ncbi:hypothetical protein BOX15_Mlig033460g2 [Macrostomum lignano]|uniref:Protein quiver n=1 Tax=Macrostomum lignano TaxID=282301 RepID=A0A267GS51_9PLAT|nr:hypothetical protein BOX15_Mlig033460g3 [Macrostomum lignano]PAA88197.1 hypothetical protein BOX15_Mlig033460g2 [Macrostomum lignano]
MHKMQNRFSSIILLLLALASTTGVLGLSCYICNSLVDKNCEVDPSADYKVNCSVGRTVGPDRIAVPNAQVCWKQSQDIEGLTIVDRTCGSAVENKNNCYDRVGTKKIKIKYCSCSTQDCNSANNGFDSSARLMTAAVAAVAVVFKFSSL